MVNLPLLIATNFIPILFFPSLSNGVSAPGDEGEPRKSRPIVVRTAVSPSNTPAARNTLLPRVTRALPGDVVVTCASACAVSAALAGRSAVLLASNRITSALRSSGTSQTAAGGGG